MNNKGALGLAINTIVVIIIALVILGLGTNLMISWISGAQDLKNELDSKTQAELERMLVDQGKKVALPLHTATVERGNSHVFGLGVLNIDVEEYGNEFTFEASLSKNRYLDEEGEFIALDNSAIQSWLLFNPGPVKINENQHYSVSILVNVPTEAFKGKYIFNVKVRDGSEEKEQYDNTKKFYVTVV